MGRCYAEIAELLDGHFHNCFFCCIFKSSFYDTTRRVISIRRILHLARMTVNQKEPMKELLENIPELRSSFEIHRKIGQGTFSTVYLGSLWRDAELPEAAKSWYAIKHLVPTTHPTRAAHELRCLREIGGKDHVIGVVKCLRHLDNVVFIMPYIKHNKFAEYVGDMGPDELRKYMRALLTALRHVHSFGVIHRDVKPSNFLYDRERGQFALVDFGLAQHIVTLPIQPPPAHLKRTRENDCVMPSAKRVALNGPGGAPLPYTPRPAHIRRERMGPPAEARFAHARLSCSCAGAGGVCGACAEWPPARANRAGTQGFRPPEVLFKSAHQSTAVDMWACGVILVSLLTGKYPFFEPEDDMSALAEITALCGTGRLKRAASALGCRLVSSLTIPGTCLRKLCSYLRRDGCPPSRACRHCLQRRLPCLCLDEPECNADPSRTIGGFPDSAFALASRLLEPDPFNRISAADALKHPFFL